MASTFRSVSVRYHRSVLVYEPTDEKIQLARGRRVRFPRKFISTSDILNHLIRASEVQGNILLQELDEAFGCTLIGIQGYHFPAGYLSVFLAIPDESEPWLFIAPDDTSVDDITGAVARSMYHEVKSEAKKLSLFFQGKPVSSATLESLGLRPLDVVQVVEERPMTMTLQIHEGSQTKTTYELSVPTTATSRDIVRLLCESDEGLEFDESKYTPYISAGFSCFGESDFPGIDVIDRRGRFVHKKNTTNFVLHQALKDEKLECLKVRMLKNDENVDSVILLPQTSCVGDLRCELGKMFKTPGNSLSIGIGLANITTYLPQNASFALVLNNLRRSKKDTPIFLVRFEPDVGVTVAVESPKKVKMFKTLHLRAQKYDPAAVVYSGVAEKMNCDPGLVRLFHQGKVLSDFALLCQCLQDPQDSCSLTAVVLEESTILRLLHKTGLCCKILVEDTARSTVADMERLVEEIHSYSRGSVATFKDGHPLDRELTISEAGLKMLDTVLVTTRDQADAVTSVPAPFQCVFQAGQDGETHRRFAVRVNGILCYVPDGVGEAELARQQEEDPICSEPVSGIHVLARIRHGAHDSSSHGATPKSCRHASEYCRKISTDGASNREKEADKRAEFLKAKSLELAAKTVKPKRKEMTTNRELHQRSARGREQGTLWYKVEGNIASKDDSTSCKRDSERGFFSDFRAETRSLSELRSKAGYGIFNPRAKTRSLSELRSKAGYDIFDPRAETKSVSELRSKRGYEIFHPRAETRSLSELRSKAGYDIFDPRAEARSLSELRSMADCGQVMVRQQFYREQMTGHHQPLMMRFQNTQTCDVVGHCSPDQLQCMLEHFSSQPNPRRLGEIRDSAPSGSLKEKDALDEAIEEIAEELGHDWSTICQSLGLAEKDVHAIEARYPFHLHRQALAGLTKWKQAKGRSATMSALTACLRKCGRADLADKLCKDDEDNSTEKT